MGGEQTGVLDVEPGQRRRDIGRRMEMDTRHGFVEQCVVLVGIQ